MIKSSVSWIKVFLLLLSLEKSMQRRNVVNFTATGKEKLSLMFFRHGMIYDQ